MARDFIDNIKAAMLGVGGIEDNNTGLVTPADVRAILTDMMDSLKEDEANLYSTAASSFTFPTPNDTWGVVGGAGIYDVATGDDSLGDAFLNVDQTAGTVTGKDVDGYSYEFFCNITIDDIPNNREIYLCVSQNGTPISETSLTGRGINDPVSRSWSTFLQTATANDVFALSIKDPIAAATVVDIDSVNFLTVIKPTNNA